MWNQSPVYADDEEQMRRAFMPDVDTTQASVAAAPTPVTETPPTTAVTLSPAQQKYQQTLEQLPKQTDYQPSKWRRVAAAIAGGLAGAHPGGGAQGAQVAQGILDQPFTRALGGWQRETEAAGKEAGVEQEAMKAATAARRAGAYERMAGAKEAGQQRQAEHYQWQEMQPQGFKPTTYEEAVGLAKAKLRPGFEDPTYTAGYQQAHPPRNYAEEARVRQVNAMDLQKEKEAAALKRTNIRANAIRDVAQMRINQGKSISPKLQGEADKLAVDRVLRKNPEYAQFYEQPGWGMVGTRAVKSEGRIKDLSELPQLDPSKDSLRRELYNQFQSDLGKESRSILKIGAGGRPYGGGDEEDDDEFLINQMSQDDEDEDEDNQ